MLYLLLRKVEGRDIINTCLLIFEKIKDNPKTKKKKKVTHKGKETGGENEDRGEAS